MNLSTKQRAYHLLTTAKVDRLFRLINRKRLLVIMYHGITRRTFSPPLWTQLPEDTFRSQLRFVKRHYRLISLSELTDAIESGHRLPENAAMITFDDGFKNNYRVAYPVLRELSIPGLIFLSTDLIDTNRFFWFDELYFIVKKALNEHRDLDDLFKMGTCRETCFHGIFNYYLQELKRIPEVNKDAVMGRLRASVDTDIADYADDLGALSWDDISEMHASGLVEFGVHTANHRILSRMTDGELEKEVKAPKLYLEKKLACDITSFCYPNGKPGIDAYPRHADYLRKCGFKVSFSTENALNDISTNSFELARVPAGNDMSSDPDVFRLTTAGIIQPIRKTVAKFRERRKP